MAAACAGPPLGWTLPRSRQLAPTAAMDFSETFRYSGPSPAYSPDGRYLAMAVEYRLVVRDVETLQVVQLYSCLDKIQYLEWSCDSQYVLCALFKRAIAQVWSIEEPDWTCKIDEGPAGIAHARWAPDGRHILTVADFHIRITVWSLISRSCVYINGPKFVDKALAFRPDGSLMALAERKNCKDAITILSTSDWTAQTTFATATMDLSDLSWSPDGGCIAVWDSLLEYKVLLYTEEGECLASYAAYSDALGVKSLQWAPNGQFLAVGSYDESARLLNHVTWSPFFEMAHTPKIEGPVELRGVQGDRGGQQDRDGVQGHQCEGALRRFRASRRAANTRSPRWTRPTPSLAWVS
eukprot:jgi/Tetstr1/448829/TSEL_036055.t1